MNSENKHPEIVVNVGGAKRKNGHKATCGCHICENIMNKAKRGDYKPKVASGKVNGHKVECRCPICKNMMAKKMKRGGSDDKSSSSDNVKQVGRQTKKLRGGKKSNGHKATCQCPICKNMRSARMSRRNKSRSNKRD
jgi:rubredoxin